MSINKLDHHYGPMKDYVRSVINGHHDLFIVKSETSLGKSYNILTTLQEEMREDDFVVHSGYSAPLAFYHKLYKARNKVLFLDDIEGLLKNKKVLANLKQATWEEDDGLRKVEWSSNTPRLEAPQEFDFNGRIIMALNKVPDNAIVRSLKSRGIYYELTFDFSERKEIVEEVAKAPYDGIPQEKREEIAEWLIEHVNPVSNDLNIRTLFNCYKFYEYNKDRWKVLAKETIDLEEPDDDIVLARKALDKHDTVKEAAEAFAEEAEKSIRTFYRKKDILDDMGSNEE